MMTFYWMETVRRPRIHPACDRREALHRCSRCGRRGPRSVPLTFTPYAEAIRDYLDDLRRIVGRKARGADPDRGQPPLPFAGLDRLASSLRSFQDAASALDHATAALAGRDGVPHARLKRVNDALIQVERAFLLADGLPGRPWFKHAIYAPGITTGYASWPLPGLRQAIEDDDPEMLAAQLAAPFSRLDAASGAMKEAETLAKEE